MADRVKQFEDLDAWQEAKQGVVLVYRLTANTVLGKDFGLKDQLQRAAVSVMSNIAEGFERTSMAEKRHFYCIARASAGEVRSLLYIIEEIHSHLDTEVRALRNHIMKAGKLITGLIKSTEARQ
ncbi:MAG: four helix bundle protein [Verrucomicrobiaceae bacterium]